MSSRGYLAAGVATLALAGGSLAVIAATGATGHPGVSSLPDSAVSTCAAAPTLSGQRVTVMLGDTGGRGPMMHGHGVMTLRAAPQSVPAGSVSLVAVNRGTRTHELVVLPLGAGQPVGARAVNADDTVSEEGSFGEASNSCGRGPGDGIRPGATSWLTLTLDPGRYELVCNLPGHYTAGMYTELDVQ